MTAWLPDILRGAGLKVTTYGVRSRPGDYEPHGVLNHHTAFPSSAINPHPGLTLVQRGRPDLPGPLCQVLIGYDGHCHVITTGRANHAGKARQSGPMSAGDGNDLYVGFEIDYSGYVAPSPAQYAATVTANAAVLTRLGRSAEYARGHRETSTTGKWDPGHVDMDRLRADIATAMRPEGDEMAQYDALLRGIDHNAKWAHQYAKAARVIAGSADQRSARLEAQLAAVAAKVRLSPDDLAEIADAAEKGAERAINDRIAAADVTLIAAPAEETR